MALYFLSLKIRHKQPRSIKLIEKFMPQTGKLHNRLIYKYIQTNPFPYVMETCGFFVENRLKNCGKYPHKPVEKGKISPGAKTRFTHFTP